MVYRFKFTDNFDAQLNEYIEYFLYQLGDPMVVRSFLRQVDEAIDVLRTSAHSYAFCEEEELRKRGVRKKGLSRYNFKIFYRVKGDTVIVDAICHDLRDHLGVLSGL